MDLEYRHGLMGPNTKEIGRTIKLKAKEDLSMPIKISMKESLSLVKLMDMVNTSRREVRYTKVI